MHRLAVTTLATAIALSACVSKPLIPVDAAASASAWQVRQQQLTALHGFELIGRVAVKGGGLSGALRWEQSGEQFRLRIAGPFGAGAIQMQGTPGLVTIRGKDIDITTSEPAAVLAARTGWQLPLDALRWWVLGLPAPAPAGEASVALDAQGRATTITQDGWRLHYSDYQSATQPELPGRIEAELAEWSAAVTLQQATLLP
jgi:outer membrane lipoprotein LolB